MSTETAPLSQRVRTFDPSSRLETLIIVLSVAIPVVVAILLYLPASARVGDLDVRFLPHLNALLNTATSVALVVSLVSIKQGNWRVHRAANLTAFGLSAIFLVSYVVYHYAHISTPFGDSDHNKVLDEAERAAVAMTRPIYLVLLLTHILAAMVVVPLVLLSMYSSLTGQLSRHRRLSRWTWPVWFFVAVSGVVVYLLIRPYYGG